MVYISDHSTVVKAEAISAKTVSYTHLDVYKRQELLSSQDLLFLVKIG